MSTERINQVGECCGVFVGALSRHFGQSDFGQKFLTDFGLHHQKKKTEQTR